MDRLPPNRHSPFAVTLTDEQQDELTNRIMSGGADETRIDEDGGVSRVGVRVVTEQDGELVCEQFESEDAARERFAGVARALGFEAPSPD